jgi:hypothetical protein
MLKINNYLTRTHQFKHFYALLTTSQIGNAQARFNSTSGEASSSLENYLISRIKMKGPLTVAEYMKEVLANPIWVSI